MKQKKEVNANTKLFEQSKIEEAIMEYQQALAANDNSGKSRLYQKICELYPVMNFMNVWMKKYEFLYDTKEDFEQDYLRIFCTSLAGWKPRHLRKESRYGGKGEFKNFFWQSLQNNYTNMVKAEASGKRNITTKCPICEDWCASLSTHLIRLHADILWDSLESLGYDIKTLTHCPFCQSFKNYKIETGSGKLARHILSMHSSYLFDAFKEIYPEYSTISSKPISVSIYQEEKGESIEIYDKFIQSPNLDDLLAMNLSDTQKIIINKIFNGTAKKSGVNYNPLLYNCNVSEFKRELDDLKNKIYICGIKH